ncbi:FAD-dependent monooxygenase [Streptomyces malaysiensis]|uniref:FAD-dependent monooxygenase n=1 Tax=Streptomyces malaysiensis TaxID=92644 RepID=UPI002B2FF4CB|nr:FAD-dependent monooxygenase [Streptomyces malaysiensis]
MKFIIAGASISGMAASCVLGAAGHRVRAYELLEGRLEDRGAGLVVDESLIASVTGRPASALGAMNVRARRVMVETIPGTTSIQEYPAGFGSTTWSCLHQHLVRSQDATVTSGVAVVGVEDLGDRVQVRLSDGSTDTADGVILADGYGSRLRSLVDPQAETPQFEGIVLLRAVMPEDACPPELRHAVFDDRMHLHNRPGAYGLMYTTPGTGGTVAPGLRSANAGIYLPLTRDVVETLFMSASGTPRNTVAAGSWLPGTAESLVADLDERWDVTIRHVMRWGLQNESLMGSAIFTFRPSRIAHGRIALIGDSGHATSPITGAGSSAALKDALALGNALRDSSGRDVDSIFAAYNEDRLDAVQSLVDIGRAWSRDFLIPSVTPENPPIVLASAVRQP